MSASSPRRLRDLGLLARFGLICTVLTLLGGSAASGFFLYLKQEGRDQREGLSVDDIKGHYHGMSTKAPLLVALENGHPEELTGEALPAEEKQALLDWLASDADAQNRGFDNMDLGLLAPSEIMYTRCLDCHGRDSTGEHAAAEIPLEYIDDVLPLAVSRDIEPVSMTILAASTHTHALGLSALTLVLFWLAVLTSWPRVIVGVVVGLTGVGLLLDIGGWWLTRYYIDFAWMIMIAGGVYNGGVGLLGLMVIVDLLLPAKKEEAAG